MGGGGRGLAGLRLLAMAMNPELLPNPTLISGHDSPREVDDAPSEEERELLARVNAGDQEARFLLGQLYFHKGRFACARLHFEVVSHTDARALYQLGVMHYDTLGMPADLEKGVDCMLGVTKMEGGRARLVKYAAMFNIGQAHFSGFGAKQSDTEAERWWLLAADDGNPLASVKAQSMLGMFYSRPESQHLKKAFFWHSEACGNGSVESQGALGLMYKLGLGVRRDADSALECLEEAAQRGSLYAQAQLMALLHARRLYVRAAELAARVADSMDVARVARVARETDCLPTYISKGIAMAAFYFGRCLELGQGVARDAVRARHYYSKAFQFDPDITEEFQLKVTHGEL
ncbi:unnamed protein product [Lampetra fluviatilis]